MSLFNTLVSKTIMHVPGPIVGYFAKAYIAGEQLSDAVRVTKDLNREGAMATIDILGEFIKNLDEAAGFRDGCIDVLETIAREKLDANLSLKPTQMGLQLDKAQAFANIRQIVARAAELGNFVRIDMEDIPCTDDTLEFYRRLREEFPGHVGVVLQAYLRRTPADIDALADAPMNFRLCKGIYNEPRRASTTSRAGPPGRTWRSSTTVSSTAWRRCSATRPMSASPPTILRWSSMPSGWCANSA